MSTGTLPDQAVEQPESPLSPWLNGLDPRGMFVSVALALAGTVAVVVLTASVLRLVTGS